MEIDQSCNYCGGTIELTYRQERVATYCTECAGKYGSSNRQEAAGVPSEYGFLGYRDLPPAGIEERTPSEIRRAALAWNVSEELLTANGTCPRCSATLEAWVDCCPDHRGSDGTCGTCGRRYAAHHSATCTNCVFTRRVAYGITLVGETELQAFLTSHGINLSVPDSERLDAVVSDYDEAIERREPFAGTFTYTVDGDELSLAVEPDLEVFDITADHGAE